MFITPLQGETIILAPRRMGLPQGNFTVQFLSYPFGGDPTQNKGKEFESR